MRISSRLRTFLVCTMLEYAALVGTPMRPEEITKLMRAMNQPTIAHTNPDEGESGDDVEPSARTPDRD